MFDLRMNSIMWTHRFDKGVCSIEFDRKDIEMNKLGVSLLKSEFHIFDLRTFNTKTGYASLMTKVGGTLHITHSLGTRLYSMDNSTSASEPRHLVNDWW